MKRLTLTLGLLALAAVLAACSGASAARLPTPAAGRRPERRRRHDRRQGHEVRPDRGHGQGRHARSTCVFDNQDGAPHNIAIYGRVRRATSSRARSSSSTKVTYAGPGARRRHLHLHLRRPSRHEGHDHRPVIAAPVAPPRSPRPVPGVFAFALSAAQDRPAERRPDGGPSHARDHRPGQALRAGRRARRRVVHRPARAASSASSAPTAPARRRRCAASSGSPGPTAARSAGRAQPVDREARLRFGYMPEQRGLYPRMRVAEQLSYFAQQHGMSRPGGQRGGERAGSSGWASATGRSPSSRSCRTATSSASSWRRRSSTTRSCSSSTSRSRASTRSASRR